MPYVDLVPTPIHTRDGVSISLRKEREGSRHRSVVVISLSPAAANKLNVRDLNHVALAIGNGKEAETLKIAHGEGWAVRKYRSGGKRFYIRVRPWKGITVTELPSTDCQYEMVGQAMIIRLPKALR